MAEVSQKEPENYSCTLKRCCPYPHYIEMEMEKEEEVAEKQEDEEEQEVEEKGEVAEKQEVEEKPEE